MAHLTSTGTDRLHDAMVARVDKREMSGMVALLACGDDVEVDHIGRLGFDTNTPMRRDTVFRIASMTKPILAAATMMLVEDGVIALDEPVDRLLPELSDRRVLRRLDGPLDETVPAHRPITIEDLLTFRLGFGHITEPDFNPPSYPIVASGLILDLVLAEPDPRTPHAPDEWIARFGSLPLMEQPGQRWRYNVGTLVAGVLVARAAGAPLGDVLRDRLFTPLGMVDTGFAATPAQARRMPGYYLISEGTGEPLRQPLSTPAEWLSEPVFPSGSGGLLSTADDFFAFAKMLRDGGRSGGTRLLSQESVAAMTTNQLTPAQIDSAGILLDGQGWGYGMSVVTTATDTGMTPGQYGWSGGYGTTWFNDPSRDLIAIALTQTSDFLWNGGLTEFDTLAAGAVSDQE
jgi:CubicO group peptidase (beta-lactamase class C family)